MELSGPAPLGAAAAIAAQVQTRREPDVHKVEPRRQTDGTATDARERPEQDKTAAAARDISRLRAADEARYKDLPAGPTPAFQVSLLEMEADLKHVIARIEAARGQEDAAQAVRAPAEAEAAKIEAEMAAAAAQDAAATGGEDAAQPAPVPTASPAPTPESAAPAPAPDTAPDEAALL